MSILHDIQVDTQQLLDISEMLFAVSVAISSQGRVWAMAMWILATAAAFSDVQSVRMPHAFSLLVLQSAEHGLQPFVVSSQSSPPLFAVRRRYAVRRART